MPGPGSILMKVALVNDAVECPSNLPVTKRNAGL